MCDDRHAGASTPRPRWGALYAIALGAAGAYCVVAAVAAAPARTVLAYALVAGAGVATLRWIARNRVALDQLEWCACASDTVRIREIPASPSTPPRVRAASEAEEEDRLVDARR